VTSAIAIAACVWLAAALAYRTLAFRALARDARAANADSALSSRAASADPSSSACANSPLRAERADSSSKVARAHSSSSAASEHSTSSAVAASVSLVRPLHGAQPSVEPCLESLFASAQRGDASVVMGFEHADDPVSSIVDRVRARWTNGAHPVRSMLRVGRGPSGANPKVSNVIQMEAGDESDLLILTDADVAVAPDFVARLTAPFSDPAIGLATCPYRSVPAASLSSRIDALVTNTHFLPSVCLAVRLEGLHFGLGAAIAVRRRALIAAGGFEALLDEAADDYAIARNIERAGWRLAWVPAIVEHRLDDEGWLRAAARHLRWGGTMKSLRPAGYYGVFTTHGLVAASIAAAALGGYALALPLAWWLATIGLAWPVRRELGMRGSDFWLLPLADLCAFGAWLGGAFRSARPPQR
jgi:ceramide glucosyltransferase